MQKVWSIIRNRPQAEHGFSVVEVLLAATIFGMLVLALSGSIIYGRSATADSGDHARAMLIAQEGIAASRNIGNSAYSNLVDGTYGLARTGGQWAFSGTSDVTDAYARQITVASAGTNRKLITSTVTWPQVGGGTNSVSSVTRIANWESNIKLWSAGVVAGAQDVTGTNNAVKTFALGNYAYTILSTTSNNFVITNISTPATPTNVITTTITGTPTNIFVSGNFAYITTSTATSALQIVNVVNPAAPSLIKSVSMTGTAGALGVYVKGAYAYVTRAASTTTGSNEFNVVSIATPSAASVVGGYNNDIQMNEVYASGNFAYVATSSTTAEMLVINVTTPASPTLGATYNPTTPNVAALTVTGYGNTVLLGMSTTLDAINVTTPTSPARLGTFTAAGVVQDIAVDVTNQYAFLGTASTTGEFQIVNIGTPASMTLAKTVDVSGTTSTVAGVAYSSAYDVAIGASASDTQEVIVFNRN